MMKTPGFLAPSWRVRRTHALFALAAFWLGGARLEGAALPFSFVSPDGDWTVKSIRKEVAPEITFELLATHVGFTDRLIVFSSRRREEPPESLTAFAHRLRSSFSDFRSDQLTEKQAVEFGYSGRRLRFKMANKTETFDCELFVFAVADARWGVLYAKPENTATTAATAFRLLRRDDPLASGSVAMSPYVVKDIPVSDFPIGFDIMRNSGGDRVTGIVVNLVPPGSTTDRAGVKVGDAIVAINGRKAVEFAAGVGKDSELGRIFLNRKPGDQVDLEILPAGATKSFPVTLRLLTPFDRMRAEFN
ncbi:MAG TPA: PDZ domain-containing protein [Opitutaceae bacterium]|nr:PDZ domain-containing protein [Opitutaceae bacterium]